MMRKGFRHEAGSEGSAKQRQTYARTPSITPTRASVGMMRVRSRPTAS